MSPEAPEATTSRDEPPGWWQRFVERRRRPHAPGVWVIYFSLAALPLFGDRPTFHPGRRSARPAVCVPSALRLHGQRAGAAVGDEFSGPAPLPAAAAAGNAAAMVNLWLGIGGGDDRRRDARGHAPAAAQRRIRHLGAAFPHRLARSAILAIRRGPRWGQRRTSLGPKAKSAKISSRDPLRQIGPKTPSDKADKEDRADKSQSDKTDKPSSDKRIGKTQKKAAKGNGQLRRREAVAR